jgi:glycopeptide antibiotics resistance protein
MKKRLTSTFILIAYSAILVKLVVFKINLIKIGHLRFKFSGEEVSQANFVPFKTIMSYLLGEHGRLIGIANLAGNIILFVPIGFLVPLVYRKMTWQKSLALAVVASLAIEGIEVLLRVGIFDIDDVILNVLGVMMGYWVFAILAKWARPSLKSS